MANPNPHVFILPLPFQGPVNCMLKLAELLSLRHIRVTFLNTRHIQARLLSCTGDSAPYYARYPNLKFDTVPDGLPEENPRTVEQFQELMDSMESVAIPMIREMVTRGTYGRYSGNPVTCLIADGLYVSAAEIASEIGAPMLYFDTISPCTVWTYMCLPKLLEEGKIPIREENLDELLTIIPGMEGIIRRRDLPGFCRPGNSNAHVIKRILKEVKQLPLAQGLIFNTFQDLDAPILSQLSNIGPKVYAIGPLHSLLNARLIAEAKSQAGSEANSFTNTNTNSIWKEDRSCISWLDSQPSKSVLYVSIGSLVIITKEQYFEMWHGFVNSGTRFLWVQRPGSVLGLDMESEIPLELSQGTKERGFIVSWASQVEVLSHPAVGGFFTHCGWNSTLESIASGKTMICWPFYVDQLVNSRYVQEVWKLGLDMKDTCDRVVIEGMIKELMGSRKDEFSQRADLMAKLAEASVREGGSSFVALDRLIEDIKFMKIPKKQNL